MFKLEKVLQVIGKYIFRTTEIGRIYIFSFLTFAILLTITFYSYHYNVRKVETGIFNYIMNNMDVEMNMDKISAIEIVDKTGDENDLGILLSPPKYILIRKEKSLYRNTFVLRIMLLKNSGEK